MLNMMIKACLLVALSCFPLLSLAEIAVIVNKDNSANLDKLAVKKIFLGKQTSFPSGLAAKPIDLPKEQAAREAFIRDVLRKKEASLSSYWARMIFSSKGVPPRVVGSEELVVQEVANNKQAIAYVNASKVNGHVRVLFTF